MKMKKKSILMASACLPLIISANKAGADNRLQYSAEDANTLTTEGNANKISFTYSHGGRKGATLTAQDPYSAAERHGDSGDNTSIAGAPGRTGPAHAPGRPGSGASEYDERGFNSQGIHRDTGTAYDEDGYDVNGYNERGFNSEGIHRDTGTPYDSEGYNVSGFNENGQYMNGGMYEDTGYTRNWTTWNYTGGKWVSTPHSETTYPWRGMYDDEGYDANGLDRNGYDRSGQFGCSTCECDYDSNWDLVCNHSYCTDRGNDLWYETTTSQMGYCEGAPCFAGDTPITLADGSTKRADEITYDDELLVWNFDEGKFDKAKPLWIKMIVDVPSYEVAKFGDGSEFKIVNQHRVFCEEAGKFGYPDTEDMPLGSHTLNAKGELVKLLSRTLVEKDVKSCNIVTAKHFNIFAGGVLTSCRLNNLYPIKDFRFVKDGRKPAPYEEFAGLDRKWYDGLRLAEQPKEIQHKGDFDLGFTSIIDYVKRMIKIMA